jgi:hypothetical protein
MKAKRFLIWRFTPALFLFGLLGCSKSVEPEPFTYSQLLTGTTSKTWKLRSIQLIEKNSAPVNFTLPACFLNDLHIFSANAEKTYEFQRPTKCNNNDPDYSYKDSWYLVNANATINFPFLIIFYLSSNITSYNLTIKSLSKTDMTLEFYDPEDDYSYRFQFTSQGG